MIAYLLQSMGMFALAAALFGIYLASLLHGDGSIEAAQETIANAQRLFVVGVAVLLVGLARIG